MSRLARVGFLVVTGAFGVPACFGDRVRPSPAEPTDTVLVSVQLLRPQDNSTVIAGRAVVVEVLARAEDGATLTGIGYVARLVLGGGRIDSVVVAFQPRQQVRDSLQFLVPAQLATNTHLSISALALSGSGRARYSVGAQVVVAQCSPDIPACR